MSTRFFSLILALFALGLPQIAGATPFTLTAPLPPITFDPSLKIRDTIMLNVTVSGVTTTYRFDTGFRLVNGQPQPYYARTPLTSPTTYGATGYYAPPVPVNGGLTPVNGVITRIRDDGTFVIDGGYVGGAERASTGSVLSGNATATPYTTNATFFANGIAGNTLYGGNAQPVIGNLGGSGLTTLATPGGIGTGEVYHGRFVSGNTILSGNGETNTGTAATRWVNGALTNAIDCGSTFCAATHLDPSGLFSILQYGDQIGYTDWTQGVLNLPGLFGATEGILGGTSVTLFYLNSLDRNLLYGWNGGLGLFGRANDICLDSRLSCGLFPTDLKGMGNLNTYGQIVVFGGDGTSYGGSSFNPGAPGNNSAVPEPSSLVMFIIGIGGLLFGVRRNNGLIRAKVCPDQA